MALFACVAFLTLNILILDKLKLIYLAWSSANKYLIFPNVYTLNMKLAGHYYLLARIYTELKYFLNYGTGTELPDDGLTIDGTWCEYFRIFGWVQTKYCWFGVGVLFFYQIVIAPHVQISIWSPSDCHVFYENNTVEYNMVIA